MNSRRNAFTLIELLVVMAIIGILAGLLVTGIGKAAENKKKDRVKVELKKLEAAIASYQAKIGVYPPDNARTPKDVRLSPLYYELLGATVNSSGVFTVPSTGTTVTKADLLNRCGTEGIVNSQAMEKDVNAFLVDLSPTAHATIKGDGRDRDIELLVVPVEGPNEFVVGSSRYNVWRYNSSNPTNNPNSYDLWAEIIVKGKTNIIGNWKE